MPAFIVICTALGLAYFAFQHYDRRTVTVSGTPVWLLLATGSMFTFLLGLAVAATPSQHEHTVTLPVSTRGPHPIAVVSTI